MADNQVEQVKQKIDIVELINERVTLKRAGRNFKGLCPFHSEKTPSFFVSPEMQMYKCFGCGENGDAFTFLQKFEGMSFPEALETLAKRAGVKLTKVYRSDDDQKRERGLEILHLATEYYHYLLTEHRAGLRAREYLKDRGVTKDSVEAYGIGYATDSWQALQDFLIGKKHYRPDELLGVGLVIGRQGGGYYDRFRGRIMFPQKTPSGQVVGFSGRVLDPTVKEAKYINTPETPWYHKGEILYGLSLSRSAIKQKDRAVVVEGELDVISSYQAGVKEVVAVKGSALTEGQTLLIRRLTHNVILSLDADEAGQEAIRRAIEIAEPAGLNLRVVQLTGGKDPDEIAKQDKTAWKTMVEGAVSVYQFYLDLAFNRFKATDGTGQKQISQYMIPILNRIKNGVEQAFYVKALAKRLGVEDEVITKEMARVGLGGQGTEDKKGKPEKTKDDKSSRQERLERYVVAAVLHFQEETGKYLDELKVRWFGEEYLQRLMTVMKQAREKTKSSEAGVILKQVPSELGAMVSELFGEDGQLFTANESELKLIFERAKHDLEGAYLRRELQSVSRKMVDTPPESVERQKLQAEYQRLSSALHQETAE